MTKYGRSIKRPSVHYGGRVVPNLVLCISVGLVLAGVASWRGSQLVAIRQSTEGISDPCELTLFARKCADKYCFLSAERFYEMALSGKEKCNPFRGFDDWDWKRLSEMYRRTGEYEKLQPVLHQRLLREETRENCDYHGVVRLWGEIGDCLRDSGRFNAAAEAYNSAIEIGIQKLYGERFETYKEAMVPVYESYAMMEKQLGHLGKFEELAIEAEQKSCQHWFDPPGKWGLRLAQYYLQNGDRSEARKHFNRAEKELTAFLGPPDGDRRCPMDWPYIYSEWLTPLRQDPGMNVPHFKSIVDQFCPTYEL
jgi:tetratricopeptide (TPR) repeat protein